MVEIAVIGGDGIGPEVVRAGMRVLEAAARDDPSLELGFTEFPWGCEYYLEHGRMMPEDGLETLASFDAIYLGAVGWPTVPDHVSLWGLLLPIRRTFDQYVNLRPARLLRGVSSPLAEPNDLDITVVRENTEGEYSDSGGRVYRDTPHEIAIQESIFTRRGVERIIRYAFEEAKSRRGLLVGATKSNGISITMPFFDEIFREIVNRLPRRRGITDARRRPGGEARARPRLLRRRGRLQPLRGPALGGDGRDRRCHRDRALGQPEPGRNIPFPVRAHPRLGARHRGRGRREPRWRDLGRRHDARRTPDTPRPAPESSRRSKRPSPRARRPATSAAPRARRR